MPLTGNPSHDIPIELAAGKPRKQAIAIAMNEKRSHGHDAGEELRWRVTVHMTDPATIGKFNQVQKSVKLTAISEPEAIEKAIAFYKKRGYQRIKDMGVQRIDSASDAKGDACPKCEGSGKLKNGDRCLRCMGTGVQGAADAKGDGMNAHLDPGSREDAMQYAVMKDGKVLKAFPSREAAEIWQGNKGLYDTTIKPLRADGPSTGTLMDILRGDSERRAKTVDMLIEASHTLTKRAASLFDKKGF